MYEAHARLVITRLDLRQLLAQSNRLLLPLHDNTSIAITRLLIVIHYDYLV